MKKLSRILFALLLLAPGYRGSARDLAARPVPILLYHSVSEDTGNPLKLGPSRFEEQMEYLRSKGFHPLFFSDLSGWEKGRPLPAKPVLITLDDGYADNYAAAYPILRRTGMKTTVFSITGEIGKPGYLTWGQLREMEASGVVRAESHTVSHPNLTRLDAGGKRRELIESRREIVRQLGHRPVALAYPYGAYDAETEEAVRLAGYRFAVTGETGCADPSQGRFTLHRILVTSGMPMEEFRGWLRDCGG
ncbi:polysaccharide deacetylase family protein [Cohnella sp. CFH 77786]|uniref:polysaccharide deacetylase family protein n=1 Tax=Cohnella sp. CFH 77786 TaxID=2662265 RepID=UPI001C60887D|nr:polysaccharide deacetylase family protein [Cohnella sp. CFH 77786]MBW5444943.1 polysaccharide deacetylase family protein [Cohnella sp. CFH 77786]